MRFLKLKRVWLGLFCLIIFGLLSSCAGTRTLMMTAPSNPKGIAAQPVISAATLEEWDTQKRNIKRAFETQIYGVIPKDFETSLLSSKTIEEHNFKANIEEVVLKTAFGPEYTAVILTPLTPKGPTPIIMMENFCPNHDVIPIEGLTIPRDIQFDCSGDGMMSDVFGYFFGRYITTPPIDMIMERGYALAVIFPNTAFPDNSERYAQLNLASPSKAHPLGAVGAWAYQFSSLSNYLKTDPRISKTITYGHSRYGKSALVAAAFDPSIDGAIAHQSGTGGASLSRDKKGETVAAITEGYPHWFTPAYQESALTVDQHQLLALIAPRPILLGNAKRDVWSDPEGAFRAAQGATPVYKLFGSEGLRQSTLTAFDPSADIAFWMRPGTHGVVKEDWPAFLDFMDAHYR
ncbi:MAG: hypothetical protein ABJN69_15095 [Hellea sp.]